jgi:formate-dependent nitrite reductase membrane component NrfD
MTLNKQIVNQGQRIGGTDTVIKSGKGDAKEGRNLQWVGPPDTYYNIPLIKKAHWSWQIIVYFFLGGLSGGAYLVSSLADLLGLNQDTRLIRSGRYLSFVAILISPILLIWDLGRPERFLHMLRVLKLRSAMSIGTWAITIFATLCGFTSVYQMAIDGLLNWFPPIARLLKAVPIKAIEVTGSLFGIVVASYTGVLLSSTAVPVWARAKHLLGPIFLTSGLSTALAALSLLLSLGRPHEETLERLDRAELIAMGTELGLVTSLIPTLGPLAKPLFKGKTGTIFTAGTIAGGIVLPLLTKIGLRLIGRSSAPQVTIGTSILVLIGGFILRYVWIVAGRASADDPRAVHDYNAMEWNERQGRLEKD